MSGAEPIMPKTIIVAGYGPGISSAVAEKFGAEGFQVAIVGRSADKLAAGVKALEAKGIKAAAFTAELGDPVAIRAMVENVRAALGPISVLEWTAFSNIAGDLLAADGQVFAADAQPQECVEGERRGGLDGGGRG